MFSAHTQKQAGFTIVELLIVIVIIGILAAITIIAYNGITTRAENTKTTQAVATYAKGIFSYNSLNGTYPIETGYPCLGSNTPQTRCGDTTSSTTCLGIGSASSLASFETDMRQVFSGSMPAPSTQTMNCGGNMFAGAFYHSGSDGKTAQIHYFIRGDQVCSGIGGTQVTKLQQDDMTHCTATFPSLP